MPELIADLFISVDGCAKGSRLPAYFGFGGPDLDRWIGDQMKRPQRHLMGRKTCEALAALPEPVHDKGRSRRSPGCPTSASIWWGSPCLTGGSYCPSTARRACPRTPASPGPRRPRR